MQYICGNIFVCFMLSNKICAGQLYTGRNKCARKTMHCFPKEAIGSPDCEGDARLSAGGPLVYSTRFTRTCSYLTSERKSRWKPKTL